MKRIFYLYSEKPIHAFAEACFAFTPQVALYRGVELFLDITNTIRFFGGEKILLQKIEDLLSFFQKGGGWACPWVLTDKPEWARAILSSSPLYLPPGESNSHLLSLPISQLEFVGDPATLFEEKEERRKLILFMWKMGIRTISEFVKIKPAAMGKRFGKLGVSLLEWVQGKKEFVLTPFSSSEPLKECIDAEEITSLEALLFCARQTLVRLEARLRGRAIAAKRIHLKFILESGSPLEKILELSQPLQQTQAILKILHDFLGNFTWDSPLKYLEIEIKDTVPHQVGQLSLFDDFETRFHDLAQFVSRLRARIGAPKVGFPKLLSSHLPERSWELTWPPPPPSPSPTHFAEGKRPLFIFDPPRSCSPEKSHWELNFSEDLLAEWWTPQNHRRYFTANTPQGDRYWVFLDLHTKEWFLHGTFD